MSRRLKLIIVVLVLSPMLLYLLQSSDSISEAKILSVDQLLVRVNEGKVTEKQIVVRGKVNGKSIKYDQLKSELRFDLSSDGSSNKIHVLLKSEEQLFLKDGETLDIEGRYMVENVFVAHRVAKK